MRTKIVFSALSFIVLSAAITPSPAASEKVAAIIEVESVKSLIADIDTVTQTLYLPSQSGKITGVIERILGSPGLTGLSTNKPFRAYVLLPENEAGAPSVVLVLALSGNGKLYLRSVSKSFQHSEELSEGSFGKAIYHFSELKLQRPGASRSLYIAIVKGEAVVGSNLNSVEFIAGLVKEKGAGGFPLYSIPGTVRLGINVHACLPSLQACLQRSTAVMKQAHTYGTPGTTMDPAKMLEAESDALVSMLGQVKTFTIGIAARSKSVEIVFQFTPMPETKLAGIFKELKPVSDKYLSTLPADAFLAAAGSEMSAIDEIIDPYCNIVEKMYGATGNQMSNMVAKIQDSMRAMKGMYSGEYAIGVIPGAEGRGVGLVEIISVNDPAKVKKFMEETSSTYNETYGNLLPGMSINLTANEPRAYKGVEILSYSYSADFSHLDSVPFFNWLKNLKWEMAFVGNDMIFAMNTPEVMNAAIDRLKTGGARMDKTKLFTDLFPQVEGKPIRIYHLSLVKLLKAVLSIVPDANIQILAMIPSDAGGVGGYCITRGEDLLGITRISFSELTALKNAVPMIGGMFAQSMLTGAMKAGSMQPDAAHARCINNLRIIDAAKEQCAMERGLSDGDEVDPSWLNKYFMGEKVPTCPAGGKYTLNPIGKNPECSIPGHSL